MTVQPGYHLHRDEHGLTSRERAVFQLLGTGLTQPEICDMLGLTKQRVQQLRKSLTVKGVLEERDDGTVWVRVIR